MKEVSIQLKLIVGESNPNCSLVKGVIGQTSVVNKLNFYIESFPQMPIPTLLFSGSHGLGKSYLAKIFSTALDRRYEEINCSMLNSSEELVSFFLQNVSGNEDVTVFFDESHCLKKDVTNTLLSICNPNSSNKNWIKTNAFDLEFDLSRMNFVFATTDAYQMFAPLRNRCEKLHFNSYTPKETIDIIRLYLKGVDIQCDKQDLFYACRGRGRDTFILSQNLKRHLHGSKVLDQKSWEDFKSLFEIYNLGLKREEFELLQVIGESQPISSSNLALKMMLNQSNIEDELEIRLRELDLITSSTRGRILTAKGEEYLKECPVEEMNWEAI